MRLLDIWKASTIWTLPRRIAWSVRPFNCATRVGDGFSNHSIMARSSLQGRLTVFTQRNLLGASPELFIAWIASTKARSFSAINLLLVLSRKIQWPKFMRNSLPLNTEEGSSLENIERLVLGWTYISCGIEMFGKVRGHRVPRASNTHSMRGILSNTILTCVLMQPWHEPCNLVTQW